jgi:hypothetical protein
MLSIDEDGVWITFNITDMPPSLYFFRTCDMLSSFDAQLLSILPRQVHRSILWFSSSPWLGLLSSGLLCIGTVHNMLAASSGSPRHSAMSVLSLLHFANTAAHVLRDAGEHVFAQLDSSSTASA